MTFANQLGALVAASLLALAADAHATLTPVDGGKIVHDPAQEVYWLADANLAFDAATRAKLGAASLPIDPSGAMDYWTAQDWVRALDNYNYGAGWLGHNDWQLPVTPATDSSCLVASGASCNSFGPACTDSDLGALYSNGLGESYPASVVPDFTSSVGPLANLQPALYWTSVADVPSGEKTFSFLSDLIGSNTTPYNFLHLFPVVQGAIGTPPASATCAVLPYTSGPAAGLAVYDTCSKTTWPANANLPAARSFKTAGVEGGTMLYATASPYVGDMGNYAGAGLSGAAPWSVPSTADLSSLFTHLGLAPGDSRLVNTTTSVGPFANFQPFFYWGCQRDANSDGGSHRSACNGQNPGPSPSGQDAMQWSFDFDQGFQGTDEPSKHLYVMVYYPAPQPVQTVSCPLLPVLLSTGGYTTMAATNTGLVASNTELECAYAASPLSIDVPKPSASDCPATATANLAPLAPWNAGAAGSPSSVAMTLTAVKSGTASGPCSGQSNNNTVTCTYQSSGAVTLSTWSYAPTGTYCEFGSGTTSFSCVAL